MPSRALSIIEEYAQSKLVDERQQAITPLVAIGTPASIARLTELALTEEYIYAKQYAEAALLALEGAPLNFAIKELNRVINDRQQKQKQLAAYGILGRLRAAGHDVSCPRVSIFSRLRLAFALPTYLYGPSRWGIWSGSKQYIPSRTWLSFSGIFFILFILTLVTIRWELSRDSLTTSAMLAFVMTVAAALVSFITTLRASSINLQLDRRAGSAAEISAAALTFLIPSALFMATILAVFVLIKSDWPSDDRIRTVTSMIIVGTFSMGAARVGTIISYGIYCNRRYNIPAQVVMGTICSLLIVTTILFFIWRTEPDARAIAGGGGRTFTQFFLWLSTLAPEHTLLQLPSWLLSISIIVAVAYTFANIDNESAALRPIIGRWAKGVFYLLSLSFGLLFSFTVYLGYREKQIVLTGHVGFSRMVYSPDGRFLAAVASTSEIVTIWDVNGRKVSHTIDWRVQLQKYWQSIKRTEEESAAEQSITEITFSPDGKLLALGDVRSIVGIWDTHAQRLTVADYIFAADDPLTGWHNLTCLRFAPDGQRLLAGSDGGTLKVLEIGTLRSRGEASVPSSPRPLAVKQPPTTSPRPVGPPSTPPPRPVVTPVGPARQPLPIPKPNRSLRDIFFLLGGKEFITISNYSIRLWDYPTLSFRCELWKSSDHFQTWAVAADSKMIAVGAENGEIKLWKLEQPSRLPLVFNVQVATPRPDSFRYYDLALSPDGRLLAAHGIDTAIKIWETSSQKELVRLYGQGAFPWRLAFSPDGKWLAAGGSKVVRLWEMAKWVK